MIDHRRTRQPARQTAQTVKNGQFSRFNARCPLHQRRCKCHIRRKLVLAPPASTGTVPFAGSVSTVDRTVLQYLRDCANLELSGYTTGNFWDRLVLQACQVEPAVRHAAIAVGEAHLEHCSLRRISAQTQQKYQKALVSLRDYVNTDVGPSHGVVLICCILLFTFDKLQQNWEAAGVHLQGALAIRNDMGHHSKRMLTDAPSPENSDSISSAAEFDEVSLMLLKMDMEATISEPVIPRVKLKAEEIGLGAAYRHAGWSKHTRIDTPEDLTKPSLILSHDFWQHVSSTAIYRAQPVSEVPQHIIDSRVRLESQCEELIQVIRSWKRSNPEPDPAHLTMTRSLDPTKKEADETRVRHAIIVLTLEAHHFVVSRMVEQLLREVHVRPTTRHYNHHQEPGSSSLDEEEPPPDAPINPWDRHPTALLAIGTKVLALRKLHRHMRFLDDVLERTFSAHVGIMEPLILLAHRASDPLVRRHAVRLVRQCEEMEGLSGLSPECILWVKQLRRRRKKGRQRDGDGDVDGEGDENEGEDKHEELDNDGGEESDDPALDIYSHKTRPQAHLPSAVYLQKDLLFGDFPL